jgi:hypothetical protein
MKLKNKIKCLYDLTEGELNTVFLPFYIGKKVYTNLNCKTNNFLGYWVSLDLESVCLNDNIYIEDAHDHKLNAVCGGEKVYPILKTGSELNRASLNGSDDDNVMAVLNDLYSEWNTINKNKDVFITEDFRISSHNNDVISDWPSSLYTFILIRHGYGAIKCSSSETGYVDLFGMPCVTPEIVKNDIQF